MSYIVNQISVRFDVSLDLDPKLILSAAHKVLSEVGFVQTVAPDYFSLKRTGASSDTDADAAWFEYCEREWHRYHDEVKAEKARLSPDCQPAVAPSSTGEEEGDYWVPEEVRLQSLPLPRLPHRMFGMQNAVSRPPCP